MATMSSTLPSEVSLPDMSWQHPDLSAFRAQNIHKTQAAFAAEGANIFRRHSMAQPTSIAAQEATSQFVQPFELQKASPDSSSYLSDHSRTTSVDSFASTLTSTNVRPRLSTLHIPDDTFASSAETYRPRSSPTRQRKSTARITPRSEKHARELELNRKAATKCRNRQKAFVENLQERAREEEERLHIQTSLVQALHDEVMVLRNEVMRQSFCGCSYLKTASGITGAPSSADMMMT